ncbi:MAG: glutathione S-transferase N-terminal domain-containing protein [Xanthomonadaceae bacterium]|nr:glutathione S-transferase N-terminal domain-containing protein [Xanthomonadaceae bacterium]
MIDLYFWPTPNGYKIALFLEEAGLDYRIVPVDIGAGDQFKPEFLAFSPNNRMPAIIDHAPADGGEPVTVFESGAILVYLAEKIGRFLPTEVRARKQVMEWLFWQMGGFGPMLGQNHHFTRYAPEKIPYAIDRYTREAERLYGVLDRRLADREFIAGEYSIADMACYPWAAIHHWHYIDLVNYPNVRRWHDAIKARPGAERAWVAGEQCKRPDSFDDKAREVLFGIPSKK